MHFTMKCDSADRGKTAWHGQQAYDTTLPQRVWAAWYSTWLLIKLTPKGVVFSFLFFSYLNGIVMHGTYISRCCCARGSLHDTPYQHFDIEGITQVRVVRATQPV